MKKLSNWLGGLTAALLIAACAALPGATFNDQAAALEKDVQLVQVAATALLRARAITVVQDQQIQKAVHVAHDGIVAAKAAQPTDPAGAAKDLALAKAQVDALKVRTGAAP